MRVIALASGVVPELGPVETIHAAAAGGFAHVGLWVEPDKWTNATTADVVAALAETKLGVIDVEVIWLKPGPLDPAHLRILDIGRAVGAANALVVSSDPDMDGTVGKLRALCDHVAGAGIRIALEFGLFTEVKTIEAASAILRAVDHPSAALLIDALHLTRSGGSASDIARIPRSWLSYAQLCDAPMPGADPSDPEAILDEAVFGRLQTGAGGLDLAALVNA
ncbi:MAG: xylose isomerase-like barrel family protein, partial [Sphingomonadales bacterium]|nr:xylose isomerase-like barrel family protein [Sphingomonadales bacterium]